MNAVIYCRVSSKEQVDGTSLESQQAACEEYAARHRMSIARIFVERGESAKFADRPELLDLLKFCAKKESAVDVLLVWKVDRLARNVGDHFSIKAALLKNSVRVVSVTEPIDANPEGKLLETILAGFAQFDNDLRAARTVQGLRHKVQEGLFPWKAPLGYKSVTRGSKKTKPDVPDEPAFSLLQRAWRELETGRYTKAEIARLLATWGLRTQAGRPLPMQTIDNIFKTSFYAGIIRDPWSGAEHVGLHIPMIDRSTFARVQRVIAGRGRSVPHRAIRPEFPLRMFVRCDRCEMGMTGSFSRGRSDFYPYYRCFHKQCGHRNLYPLKIIHGEFSSFLGEISPTREKIERVKAYLREMVLDNAIDIRSVDEKRTVDIEQVKSQQQQLIRLRVEQMISDDEFVAQRSLLVTKLAELESEQLSEVTNPDEIATGIEAIAEPLMALPDIWRAVSTDHQRRFQQIVLPKGYIFGRVGTAQRGRLFSLFERFEHPLSRVVPLSGLSWNQMCEELKELSAMSTDASAHPL